MNVFVLTTDNVFVLTMHKRKQMGVLAKSWDFMIKTLVKTCDTTGRLDWEVGEFGSEKYFFKFISWRNQITHISIYLSEGSIWIAMWYGFAFSELTMHVINQIMLKSNDKSRSIDQERPVNTNPSSVSFFLWKNDYGPKEYDKSNKNLPCTQTSSLYPVNNVSQNFFSN